MSKAAWSLCAVALAVGLALGLAGCANGEQSHQRSRSQEGSRGAMHEESFSIDDLDLDFSKRDLNPSYDADSATKVRLEGTSAVVEGEGASADGATVTFSEAGTYLVSGELTAGQLVVDAGDEDKFQIVLDNAKVTNATGPALYVANADKCFITLADGSQNSLADGEAYELEGDDDNRDAALFSRDDLTINGSGVLVVSGNYQHGIASKDDLVIAGGAIAVTSKEDALQSKDAIKVADGNVTIEAGDDGLHSDGFVYVKDGSINVNASVEGFEGEQVIVDGGEHRIIASDDAINAALSEDSKQAISAEGGMDGQGASDGAMPQGEPEGEMSGKAQPPADDPREAQRGEGFEGKGGPFENRDDAGQADGRPDQDGRQDAGREGEPPAPPEGAVEGQMPSEPPVEGVAPDESFGQGGPIGGMDEGMSPTSASCLIQINGGSLYAQGGVDGLDSNGSVEINGGTVLVVGATAVMDGSLDYDLEASINGGTVLMVGDVGSTRGLDASAQAWALEQVDGSQGQVVELIGPDDTSLANMTVPVGFSKVFVSSPAIEDGQAYSIKVGESIQRFTMDQLQQSGA